MHLDVEGAADVGLAVGGRSAAQFVQRFDDAFGHADFEEVAGGGGGGGGSAVGTARAMIGTPYAYGGASPGGFDCSGLMVYAFKQAGVMLPRTSYSQWGVGVAVSRANVQAGDLVFFNSNGPGASHVGVATGPSSFISATSNGVMETSIDSSYWSQHYVGARRVS